MDAAIPSVLFPIQGLVSTGETIIVIASELNRRDLYEGHLGFTAG